MGGQLLAEGADISISQSWADYLDPFKQIAGTVFAVFMVAMVIIFAIWMGASAFTSWHRTQAGQRFFGILTIVALAGTTLSGLTWVTTSKEEGGAGLGTVTVSAGEQPAVQVGEHEPKQWDVDDLEGEDGQETEQQDETDGSDIKMPDLTGIQPGIEPALPDAPAEEPVQATPEAQSQETKPSAEKPKSIWDDKECLAKMLQHDISGASSRGKSNC